MGIRRVRSLKVTEERKKRSQEQEEKEEGIEIATEKDEKAKLKITNLPVFTEQLL